MKNKNVCSTSRMRNMMLCILMGVVMCFLCPHSVQAAEPLNLKDFTWKINGKKLVFEIPGYNDMNYDSSKEEHRYLDDPGDIELLCDWRTQPIYKKNRSYSYHDKNGKIKQEKNKIVTARGIKMGSTYSQVSKKYGKKKLVTSKKSDVVKKDIANRWLLIDTTKWKYYNDYTYDKCVIRFYYTKAKKVTAMAVINDIKQLDSVGKDPVEIRFVAPTGKKIRTKTVCGTKVYVLPKGSKITFNKSAVNKKGEFIWNYGIGLVSKNLKLNLGFMNYDNGQFKKNVKYDAGSFCKNVMKFDQERYPSVCYSLDKNGKKIYYYDGDKAPVSTEEDRVYHKAPKGTIWHMYIYPQQKGYSMKQVYYTFE